MSKEFFDWETVAGPGAGLDILSNSVRKGIEFDSFAGVTTFRARVLTDAYPLNTAQAELFNSSDQIPLQSGMRDNAGDNFTGGNVEVALEAAGKVGRFFMRAASLGQPDAQAAGSAVAGAVLGFGGRVRDLVTGRGPFDEDAANASGGESSAFFGFIFKARILGPNSPHAFIPDPCNDAFLECPEKAIPYVMMHTSFITTGENQEGGAPSKGDIVIVQLTQNEFSFNLQFGEFIKRESTNVQNINERLAASKAAQCQSLSSLFGATPEPPTLTPSPPPHVWRDKIFATNGWIKDEYIPNKIQEIPDSLNAWLRAQGRTDVTISSNGKRRGVRETFGGGAGRIPTSYHMFGLAHDLKLETPAVTTYAYPASNDILIKDHQLMRLLKKYAAEKNLEWGGAWAQGFPEQIPAGDGVEAFTAYTMELHHFELLQSELEGAIHPRIVAALSLTRFTTANLLSPGRNREELYEEIATEFGVV